MCHLLPQHVRKRPKGRRNQVGELKTNGVGSRFIYGSWLEWVAMLPASSMKMPSGGTRGWQQPKDKVYGAGLQAVISDDTESPKVIGTLEKYHAS